ncbi:hypothetical protein [Shewanella surugensis]|uniref:Secreted protein n=1 Tax=Shewanella surugensis TaxID=212020 RepID=A0ABT0LH17_9GAMM|nr:hypothetical protein [Shewanella surugensis]MCL1126997.1 hypothetical protein [Shewanella surugensis]
MFQKVNRLIIMVLSGALLLSTALNAAANNQSNHSTNAQASVGSTDAPLVQCPTSANLPNRFALCAAATCWTLDGLAYCKCNIMQQQSISMSFDYQDEGQAKNICDLLLTGTKNGFTISTYATPRQIETNYRPNVEKLGPPMGFYTCATKDDLIAYGAQCDGGICFNSTQGKFFPGLGHIKNDEIVCSCPPTLNPTLRFQIAGPWKCKPGDANENNQCCDENYYNDMCQVTSVSNTGTRLAVSAPAGSAVTLSTLLDGEKPSLNTCQFH